MNKRIQELYKEATGKDWVYDFDPDVAEAFALLIVHDFLSELTNDDSLGEVRIATIRRLAGKWGLER